MWAWIWKNLFNKTIIKCIYFLLFRNNFKVSFVVNDKITNLYIHLGDLFDLFEWRWLLFLKYSWIWSVHIRFKLLDKPKMCIIICYIGNVGSFPFDHRHFIEFIKANSIWKLSIFQTKVVGWLSQCHIYRYCTKIGR